MYKYKKRKRTALKVNRVHVVGEHIETKIERMVNNKEPITDGAPEIFTERKDGILSAYNVRTDRWEVAVDAMDAIDRARTAKREAKAKMEVIKNDNKDGGAEPVDGTSVAN